MFDFAQPSEGDYPELVEAATNARQMLVRQAEGMIASGQIEGEPVMVAHMLWAALHGAVVLQMAGKLSPGIDPAKLRRDTFRAIVKGLSPA